MLDMKVIVAILVVMVVLVLMFLGYLSLATSIKREKRIAKFALSMKKEDEKAFFEVLLIAVQRLISSLGRAFSKSVFLTRYAARYDKHISYEERNEKKNIDFVSVKFLIGILLVILNVISILFQFLSFSFMNLLVTFIIGFFIPDIVWMLKYSQKRRRVEEDLLKAIIIMNNAFKSGRNIVQAVEIVKSELDGPISDEFSKIYMDMTYGLSLEVVFNRFYDRVQLEDAKYIVSSLTLLNKTGGNIVKVFASIEKSFYNKKKLRDEMKSLTSSSIFVFRILLFLPLIFALVIMVLNPSYFKPMFTEPLGMLLLGIMIIIFILYIVVVKKVLRIDIK